jgi:hypothetical protein
MKKIYYIVPHTRGWSIFIKEAKRDLCILPTRRGAEKRAIKIKNYDSIYICDNSGRIIDVIDKK